MKGWHVFAAFGVAIAANLVAMYLANNIRQIRQTVQ